MSVHEKCSHGVPWERECLQCELVGLHQMVTEWKPKIERAEARIVAIIAHFKAQGAKGA